MRAAAAESASLCRLLALSLTDGKQTVKAMEFKPVSLPKEKDLPPGTKVLLSNVSVRAGVILLDDKSFKVRLPPMPLATQWKALHMVTAFTMSTMLKRDGPSFPACEVPFTLRGMLVLKGSHGNLKYLTPSIQDCSPPLE